MATLYRRELSIFFYMLYLVNNTQSIIPHKPRTENLAGGLIVCERYVHILYQLLCRATWAPSRRIFTTRHPNRFSITSEGCPTSYNYNTLPPSSIIEPFAMIFLVGPQVNADFTIIWYCSFLASPIYFWHISKGLLLNKWIGCTKPISHRKTVSMIYKT